jgi:hypothetical protein
VKRRKKRKLTKAERKAISLRNLAKAHRGRKKGKGYKPRTLSRRRFKKKRVGLLRFGKNRGSSRKVLTTGERRRRRRRRKNPVALLAANPVKRSRRKRRRNPWHGQPRRHAKAAKKGWARRRRGKRKAKKASGHRSSKRSRAAKKAARTRARNKAERSARARKAARSRKRGGSHKRESHKRKSSKRSHASGHRKSPKRVKAAKKAARTRKRNKNHNARAYKRAGGRRYTPASHQLTAERRRRRSSRRSSRRRNPLMNPLPNPMHDIRGFLSKAAGFGVGYLIQDGIDRFAATHVLAIDTAGNITDTPPAGTIYDSESPDLPIWSSWQRLAFNAAGLAIPGFMAKLFWKEFWQRALIAATVRTVGKVAVDAVAHFAPPAIAGGLPLRLYGANYAAQAKINQANVAALPASPAGVFAGIPRMLGLLPAQRPIPRQRQLAAPQQQRLLGGCGDGSVSSLMTDPVANSPAASLLAPTPQNCGCSPFNPLTAGTGPSTDVLNVTPTPSGGGWGGGGGGEGTIPVSVLIPPPVQTTTSTPSSAPVPSSGSGSGGGSAPTPPCDQGTIGSLKAALAAFNGSGYQPSQSTYEGIAGQLAACGITAPPWTPPVPPPNAGTVVR